MRDVTTMRNAIALAAEIRVPSRDWRGVLSDAMGFHPDDRRLFMAGLSRPELSQLSKAAETDLGSRWGMYVDDPVGFTEDVLLESVWSLQGEVLKAIPTAKRIIVPAGFGLGKTLAAGYATLWFGCVYPVGTATVVTTATRFRQVQRQLWPHIRRLHAKAGLPGDCDMTQWKMPDPNGVDTTVAYGFSAPEHDEAAMQGIHCMADDAEVLTADGWKPIPKVTTDDRVLQLDGDTAVWGPVNEVIEAPFDGYLNVHDGPNARVSFAVTDNHRFVTSPMHYRKTTHVLCRYCDQTVGAKGIARHELQHLAAEDPPLRDTRERVGTAPREWSLVEYQDLPQEFFIRRTNRWAGTNPATVTFPAPASRKGVAARYNVDRTFTFTDWAEFLGWYVSEGWTEGNRVSIAQQQGQKYEQIAVLLERMGVPWRRGKTHLSFCSEPIAAWLRVNAGIGSEHKRIPKDIKEASPEAIRVFLDAFRRGDGCRHTHPESARYITSSPMLADDLHEVMAKMGTARKMRVMHPAGSVGVGPSGQSFVRERPTYMLNEAGRPSDSNVSKANVRRERHIGNVYCLRTPTETFMVRRDGCPMWSGNSAKLLLIVDEAGGISRLVGSSTRNLLTGDAHLLAIGNPATDDEASWFESAAEDGMDVARTDTVTIRISALDSPAITGEDTGPCKACPASVPEHPIATHLVDQDWVDDAIREHGEGAPYVVAKVMADFPKGGASRAIPASYVDAGLEAAGMGDWWEPDEMPPEPISVSRDGKPYPVQPYLGADIKLGVDVAADGGDELVICRLEGDLARIRLVQSGAVNENATDVAGKILEEIHLAETLAAELGSETPVRVKVDAIGIGWGVCGILEAWGSEGMHDSVIVRVVVSESPDKPDNPKAQWRPFNKRAEMWLNGRELLQPDATTGRPRLRLDVDGRCAAQLRAPEYGTNASGRQVIESKKSMKDRGVSSPDRAEAVLLAGYEPKVKRRARVLA